ncbi:MAG: tRNA (adenosine(37)-N6)-threonylcarbamoyltransferase complex ATPase subunit type 1 TsaE [Phycisphaerales bacterium]|nr:tRNA (adenosine(37)-N6)-threonylcarbamoyltransferase complex ATPase subunit type 1 TsaE [Phycisphaerales bacterium]
MTTIVRQSPCVECTGALAHAVALCLRPGDVVRLEADLGGGKTTFVRALATALGATGVSSPTFVIINRYAVPAGGLPLSGGHLIHVDAYRVGDVEELANAGWDRLFEGSTPRGDAVALVEWPARIDAALPPPEVCLCISLTPTGETARRIELRVPDAWGGRAEAVSLIEREPVICPVSGVWVSPVNPEYPFASARARMADLGKWFGESFRSSRGIEPEDVDEL